MLNPHTLKNAPPIAGILYIKGIPFRLPARWLWHPKQTLAQSLKEDAQQRQFFKVRCQFLN